jgi:hypothetical protein
MKAVLTKNQNGYILTISISKFAKAANVDNYDHLPNQLIWPTLALRVLPINVTVFKECSSQQ